MLHAKLERSLNQIPLRDVHSPDYNPPRELFSKLRAVELHHAADKLRATTVYRLFLRLPQNNLNPNALRF